MPETFTQILFIQFRTKKLLSLRLLDHNFTCLEWKSDHDFWTELQKSGHCELYIVCKSTTAALTLTWFPALSSVHYVKLYKKLCKNYDPLYWIAKISKAFSYQSNDLNLQCTIYKGWPNSKGYIFPHKWWKKYTWILNMWTNVINLRGDTFVNPIFQKVL